ncbi:MAG: DUF819 family protein [Rhodothermales bacterium]
MITDSLAIFTVLWAVVLFALYLVGAFPWARRMSTILWVLFTSALLSNAGLIPTDAPIYGAVVDFTVPFAVCLILFKVDLSDIRSAGRPMLVAFALACAGTAIGVVIANVTTVSLFADLLGDDAWKLAGPYTGTYIGGSLNFVALWSGLQIENQDLFAAANAVDNLALFPLYALWVAVPAFLARRYATAKQWAVPEEEDERIDRPAPRFDVWHVAALVGTALAVMAVSTWIKAEWVDRVAPAVPGILIVTTLALIAGQIPAVRRLEGAWELSELVFLAFFASIGAQMNFYLAVVLSPALFLYVAIVVVFDVLFVYGIGWAMRMDPRVLTIAQVAAKSGPAMVLPLAETLGSRHLVLAGLIVAMLGYALGNYAGFAVAQIVRLMLGG